MQSSPLSSKYLSCNPILKHCDFVFILQLDSVITRIKFQFAEQQNVEFVLTFFRSDVCNITAAVAYATQLKNQTIRFQCSVPAT